VVGAVNACTHAPRSARFDKNVSKPTGPRRDQSIFRLGGRLRSNRDEVSRPLLHQDEAFMEKPASRFAKLPGNLTNQANDAICVVLASAANHPCRASRHHLVGVDDLDITETHLDGVCCAKARPHLQARGRKSAASCEELRRSWQSTLCASIQYHAVRYWFTAKSDQTFAGVEGLFEPKRHG